MRYSNRFICSVILVGGTVSILLYYYKTRSCLTFTASNTIIANNVQPFFGIWCGKVCWKRYISDQFYNIWKDLEDVHGWKEVASIASENRHWLENDTIESYFTRYFKQVPDLILFVESFEVIGHHSLLPDWRLIRHPWLFMNDIHAFNAVALKSKKLAMMAAKNIISPYPYKIDDEYSKENQTGLKRWSTFHRTWLPHSASPSFLVGYNRNPKKKILLSGAINEAYPYRKLILKMMNQKKPSKLKNIIEYHKHPGYKPVKNPHEIGAREGYGPLINLYFAAVTDTLSRNYIVAKIFEIPAAGALLLLNSEAVPILTRLNWFENVHYVTYNKTNMESVLLDVVSEESFEKYEKIRWTGHQAALEFHTTKRRALFLHNMAISNHYYA